MSAPEHPQDEIDTVAAEWAARLGGDPLNEAESRDLDRWLHASRRHMAAFGEAQAVWANMGKLRLRPGALACDIVPPRKPSPAPAFMRAAALAACVLAVMGWAAAFWFGDPMIMIAADFRTAPGEQRLCILSDGSSVQLGPASAIAVHYTDGTRRVELLSGLAYFIAAPMTGDERRPFVVGAANGTARALGTQFMVERLPEAVEVTVAEHNVQVALTGTDLRQPQTVLAPGQSVRYAASGLGSVQGAGLDRAMAWRRGSLIFDQRPLGEVVAELNRYRHGRIVITDPALAFRVVSGVFQANDTDAALATITGVLGVQTASFPPLVTLLY